MASEGMDEPDETTMVMMMMMAGDDETVIMTGRAGLGALEG